MDEDNRERNRTLAVLLTAAIVSTSALVLYLVKEYGLGQLLLGAAYLIGITFAAVAVIVGVYYVVLWCLTRVAGRS